MTSAAQFQYESNAPIITSDNYSLKIRAHVEYNNNSQDQIQSVINSTSIAFFKTLTLFEAFNLLEDSEGEVNRKYHQNILDEGERHNLSLTKFVLTTMDAIHDDNSSTEIKIELDPKLEGGKKKSGLMGRLFGKK